MIVIPKVMMFQAYWKLGPHKYSESFLLTVNVKHIRRQATMTCTVIQFSTYA